MTEVATTAYCRGTLEASGFPLADVSDYLARPDTIVWVDLLDPADRDLEELAAELGLHELAVEDALGPHQRPKLDYYATHMFLACHAVAVDVEQGALAETEVDAFVDQRWLVTVRKGPGFTMADVVTRIERSRDLGAYGVPFLLYALLDVVVDGYFEAVEAFDDYYDDVSQGIFAEHPLEPRQQRHWFRMRQALVRFHRVVVPMRETVSGLMRREHTVIAPELYPYYQDVYDHVLRVGESTEALRDLVGTIVETNLSLRDYRQNLVMKKVTSWAAIIAVPTLVTSYYGMNVPYPGSGGVSGVVTSAALMLAASGALYAIFRSRDWL